MALREVGTPESSGMDHQRQFWHSVPKGAGGGSGLEPSRRVTLHAPSILPEPLFVSALTRLIEAAPPAILSSVGFTGQSHSGKAQSVLKLRGGKAMGACGSRTSRRAALYRVAEKSGPQQLTAQHPAATLGSAGRPRRGLQYP